MIGAGWGTRIGVALPLVLAGVIVIGLGREVVRDAVNVPSWDHWGLAGVIADAYEGRLDLALMWRQHNEHRSPVPRALMVALALASGWDVRWEVGATFVLGMVGLAMLVTLCWRGIAPSSAPCAAWAVLGTTAAMCTMRAWQHWLWGWQVHAACNVAATIVTVWLLAGWSGTWGRTGALVLASVMAALSFGSGMILLALLPAALLLHPSPVAPARRLRHVAAAVLLGGAFVAIYLVGYTKPARHPSLASVFEVPGDAATYALAYLGNVLGSDVHHAAVWGGAGLVSGVLAAGTLWRREPELRVALLPWAMLALYAIGTAVVTTVGRVGFGVQQALAARYAVFSGLFWAGVTPIVVLAGARAQRARQLAHGPLFGVGAVTGIVAVLGFSGWLAGWDAGAARAREQRRTLRWLRPCLRHAEQAPDACLRRLHPSPKHLRWAARRLAALEIGPFADWHAEPPLSTYARASLAEPPGRLDSVTLVGKGDLVEVRGWAVDPVRGGHARTVLVTIGDEVLGRAWTGLPTPELAKRVGRAGAGRGGFDLRIRRFRLAGRSEPLRAWVMMDDGRIVATSGALHAPVPVKERSAGGGRTLR